MKIKYLRLAGMLFITAGISVFAVSCTKTMATDTALEKTLVSIPVAIEPLVQEQISIPIHISGNINASKESRLSFKTGGIIRSIKANEGDQVKKGQVLAQLDLKEINQQVLQAKTGLDKALRDHNRIANLYNDTVATLEQFENSKSALELAEAQLNIAEYNLQFSTITAPTNGIILHKFMEENEITGAGTPIFYFASSNKSWKMTTGVSDKEIVKLKIGDIASIETDAYPGKTLKASISQIGNAPEKTTGLFEIELTIENTSLNLKPGFFTKGDIYPSETILCYKIPVDAVQEGIGNIVIFFTYNQKTKQANKMETAVLFMYKNYLYVKDIDIRQNALVITQAQKELRHNDNVAVKQHIAKN